MTINKNTNNTPSDVEASRHVDTQKKDIYFFEKIKPEIVQLYQQLKSQEVEEQTIEHIIHIVFGKKYVGTFSSTESQDEIQEITDEFWSHYPEGTAPHQIPQDIIDDFQNKADAIEDKYLQSFLHTIQPVAENFGAKCFIARFQNGFDTVYVIHPRNAKNVLTHNADLLKSMNISLEKSAKEIITEMQEKAHADFDQYGDTVVRLFGYLMGASKEGVDQFFINDEKRSPEFSHLRFDEQDDITLPYGLVDKQEYHQESFALQRVIEEIKKAAIDHEKK